MDTKRFLQLVEEKKRRILEKKEAPLKWEQKLEAAAKAKADAETKEKKLKLAKHKKRNHYGSDYDSDSDSSDSDRKPRKKRTLKKHRKHGLSDSSEDGGKRKHRLNKRSFSSSGQGRDEYESSSEEDLCTKKRTYSRKHRGQFSRTDSSSSGSSSQDDEDRTNSRSHSRHRKHHCRSSDEDSGSDLEGMRRHLKHKRRSNADGLSDHDDHKHGRSSWSPGKTSDEEYEETGKPRNHKKHHQKYGHHHHQPHRSHRHHHNCYIESGEACMKLGEHGNKESADETHFN